ncbi:hypothetical protein B0I37DRAFT_430806 [Chaetomium sp. MPI-CAGE-AT-0009]|nr:hypothetical protein B0I37DRAFT_430806 [Chaetomium sp. MPI-CAGE-AT-0009]
MAAIVDSVVAELGLQRTRAELLTRELNRRDTFISRNTLRGPEAYSAAAPETNPGLFVVGSDNEGDSSDSDSDNDSDESMGSFRGTKAVQPPTATPVTQVQPSEIKPITLPPKGQAITLPSEEQSQDDNVGTVIVAQNNEIPLDDSLTGTIEKEESPEDRRACSLPPQAEVDRGQGPTTEVDQPNGYARDAGVMQAALFEE